MARQTVPYFQWLVYDDGNKPTRPSMGQEYYYCPQYAGPHSLINKIYHAFNNARIKGDAVAFIEDDDWYSPQYLERMVRAMQENSDAMLVGEGHALYYNVAHRWWWEHGNMKHASLCQTVVHKRGFMFVLRQCAFDKSPFLDVRLWRNTPTKHIFAPPAVNQRMLIGMKSMPGRAGIGSGHRRETPVNRTDPTLAKLRSLIGTDANLYERFYQHTESPTGNV